MTSMEMDWLSPEIFPSVKTILEESQGCLNKIFHSIKNELPDESNNSLFINFNPNYYYSIPNSSDLVVKVPVNE